MCIAASVSELVSAYPTCGGLYFTVSRLIHPTWVPSISWVVGWLNLLGQVAGVASSEYGAAQILLAAVSLGTNGSYTPTTGHTVAVQAGMTVFHGVINSFPTKWLAKITTSYIVFHGLVILTCSIALLAMCPDRHTGSYVFTLVDSESGWNPIGWSFLFGFLSVSWTMTDYDATAHITEEIDKPETKAPWAIFIAMALTYVVGWLFTIVLAFVMGDPADVLASSLEQPVIQIFYNNLGRNGAIVYAVCAFVILNSLCIVAIQALARTVFAFSRDRLLPGSKYWKVIDPRTDTPIIAVWFSVFWCAAINLIALGSYIAIAAIFNVCAIALDWSYCIPIICKLLGGRFQPGPWHMGKFSTAVNIWACVWTAFVSIIFLFPTAYPVTADNVSLQPYLQSRSVANGFLDELRRCHSCRYPALLRCMVGYFRQTFLRRSSLRDPGPRRCSHREGNGQQQRQQLKVNPASQLIFTLVAWVLERSTLVYVSGGFRVGNL